MPRISSEKRAAAAFRAGGDYKQPPAHLTKQAKALWIEIVEARPVDYFAPGSFELLEQYCELTIVQRKFMKQLAGGKQRDEFGAAVVNRVRDLAHTLATLATKLRISIQSSVDRKSGKLTEKGAPAKPDNLIGGKAVWGDRPAARAN